MQGFKYNTKFFKILLFFIFATLLFTLNTFPDMAVTLGLKFEGINEIANKELFNLFVSILVLNYLLEITLRYLKYQTLYYWI